VKAGCKQSNRLADISDYIGSRRETEDSKSVLRPCRWSRNFSAKRRLTFDGIYGVISHKIELFVTTTVRTSNYKRIHLFRPLGQNCYYIYLLSFIHSSMALQPFVEPWSLLQFLIIFFAQAVGIFGRVISPSQGRYLYTVQHKQRINAHRHPCLE
jgi:hypothetical protein